MKQVFIALSVIAFCLVLVGQSMADTGYYPSGYWPWDKDKGNIELGFADMGMKFDSVSYGELLDLGYGSLTLSLLGGVASNTGHMEGFTDGGVQLSRENALEQWGESFEAELANLVYKTIGKAYTSDDAKHFKFLLLTEDFEYKVAGNSAYSLLLSAGSIIIGIDDTWAGDRDFNDLLMIGVKYAPAPVPGAAWLLGSGLAGLLALRKRKVLN